MFATLIIIYMTSDEKLDVLLGFTGGDDKWLASQLETQGKANFDPAEHTPRHIILANEPEKQSIAFQYVRCLIPVNNFLQAARAGLEGERCQSLTVHSATRPSTREVFRANCAKTLGMEAYMMTDGWAVPEDIDQILDDLLVLGHVHIMAAPSITVGDKHISSFESLHSSNEDFLSHVRAHVNEGRQAFLYGCKKMTRLAAGQLKWYSAIVARDGNQREPDPIARR